MKACPFCAEEIQDAAIVCKHCGRDIPVQTPRQSDGSGARGNKVGIALLVILGIFVSTYIVNAVSEADALSREKRASGIKALASSVVVDIAPMAEVDVSPNGYKAFQWEVPSAKTSCHLTGRVEVVDGGNKDVEVFLVSHDDYTNLRNGNSFRAFVSTPRTSVVTLDERISSAGTMVLVVSNKFSVVTPKRVQITGVRATCT